MRFSDYIPFYKRNLKIALPIMLSQLGGAITQLADNIMVGQLGTVELAAASFANAVFSIGFVFAIGISMASTPVIGIHFVQNDDEKVSSYLQNSLLMILISGIILSSLLAVACLHFNAMGQDEEVIRLAIPYYWLLVASLLPFMLFAFFKQFLEGLGNTKVAMIITIIANVINIIFNYFWIFGACGFSKLGVAGAGAATLLSRIIMPVLFILAISKNKQWYKYFKMFELKRFSFEALRKLFGIGLPISVQMGLEMCTFSFSAIMVGWMGATSLASHQITISMSMMTFMAVIGIASATTIRVSHQFGLRDYKAMRMAANASVHLSLAINVTLGILVISFRNIIPLAFSSDPAVIELSGKLLFWLGCFQVVDSLQGVGLGILRGITDVFVPMVAAFISYCLLCLPIGYLLGFKAGLGAEGIWIAFTIGLIFAALFYHLRIQSKFKYFAKLQGVKA